MPRDNIAEAAAKKSGRHGVVECLLRQKVSAVVDPPAHLGASLHESTTLDSTLDLDFDRCLPPVRDRPALLGPAIHIGTPRLSSLVPNLGRHVRLLLSFRYITVRR